MDGSRMLCGRQGDPMTDQVLSPEAEIAAARAIATIAHRIQKDKIGEPYIDHPRRVAEKLMQKRPANPKEIAAAWLHDVVEDCGITEQDLIKAGISREVADAVVLLTRTEAVEADAYYEAIRQNPIALAVKLADIDDNTDDGRTARLSPELRKKLAIKYEKARKSLQP
jgi:(p)ppGpp synthase/HD superfamily hydrolase